MAMVTVLAALAVFVLSVMSAASDIRALRIPNLYSLLILLLFIPAFMANGAAFGSLWAQLAAMVGMFVITYVMFSVGMIGGGDSKLATALGLWVGLSAMMAFVFYMALAGGVLGVISLYLKKKKPFAAPAAGSWFAQVQEGRNAVPYGVAISFGAWMALLHAGFVHNQIDELMKIIH